MRIVKALLLAGGLVALATLAPAQPPGGGKGDKKEPPKGGFPGKGGFGPGGPGGRMMPQPGVLLPSFLQEALKMTAEQKKQVEELQKEVDAKLAKILTADQLKQLKEMKDRGPGGPPGKGKGGNPPPPSPSIP